MINFNLQALDEMHVRQEEGVDVPIFLPGSNVPIFSIKVTGPDSKAHRRAIERGSEEHAARGSLTPLTIDEQNATSRRFLARICVGWDVKDADGADIPFSEDAAYELFERYPVVYEQVNNAAGNRVRFTKRSPTA